MKPAPIRGAILALATLIPLVLISARASAQSIDIDKNIVTNHDALKARLTWPKTADVNGADVQAHLVWTDCWKRTIADENQKVTIDGNSAEINLPLARSVGMNNYLEAELLVGGKSVMKFPRTQFIVTPDKPWDDYQIVMYFAYSTPQQQWALRDFGITAGQIQHSRTQDANGGQSWWQYDYQYYCDQIADWFYAAYHTPTQRPKNKKMTAVRHEYQKDSSNKEIFYRDPSLSDPAQLSKATGQLHNAVAMQMRFKPLFYACTDEGGVAELASAWDFDFSPVALDAMRKWLMEKYGSLEAINKEWGTNFAKIEEVVPFTTDQAMARTDGNYSPWADHRYFMNKSFADAVHAGADAGHQVDPHALVGLVGCQMPSAFGGYNYWRLSQVLDCIEPYNIGDNREIWRSFARHKPAMTTSFGVGNQEIWRLWYQALYGDQGIIFYDEQSRFLTPDAHLTDMAKEIHPTYNELTGGIVKQLHYMQWDRGPIAIHYSQPSITAHWMIEFRPEGKAWATHGSAFERQHSDFFRLRESWTKLLEDDQRQSDFVAYAQLENGEFAKMNKKVLILPQSIAMSAKECQAVRDFVDAGGTVIADCQAALMDENCKMLDKGQLNDLFGIERSNMDFKPGAPGLKPVSDPGQWKDLTAAGALDLVSAAEPGVKPIAGAVALYQDASGTPAVIVHKQGKGMAIYLNAIVTDYHRWRLLPPQGQTLERLADAILNQARATVEYPLTVDNQPAHGVEVFPFTSGDLKIIAFHRNYQLRINELGPPEYRKEDALEKAMRLTVNFDKPYAIYDVRSGKYVGQANTAAFDLDTWQPTILALLPEPLQAVQIDAPDSAAPGALIDVKLAVTGPKVGDVHALHFTIAAPDGKEIVPLTQNVLAPKGMATIQIPFALSDPQGDYTLTARDAATGMQVQRKVTLK